MNLAIRRVLALPLSILDTFLSLFEVILTPLQRTIGVQRMGYFFVLPNLLIFGIFVLLPMLLNFTYSFTGGEALFLENRTWVGTENLQTLLTCENYLNYRTCEEDFFWRSLGNTVVFVVFEVSLILLLSLVTAVALNQKIRGRGIFRSVFFYPVLLSPVVVALIWKWILQDRTGLLNSVITSMGGESITFFADPNWTTFWVIVVSVWAQMGFYALILLAGLQSIPPDLYEAGAIDGANSLSQFRYITFPLLMPTMVVVLVLSLIRAVQVFDVAYVLNGGGPGTATKYLIQYIYETAFTNRNYGLAAGASLVMAAILLVLTGMQLRLRRDAVQGEV